MGYSRFEAESDGLLVSNMAQEASQMETFPVLIGDEIAYFHSVSGGYNKSQQVDVVNLVHHVQDVGSPYHVNPEQASHNVEMHLSENYYNLNVSAIRVVDEYPDEDYVLSLKVDDYRHGARSFSDALSEDVDRRETRHEY